MYRETQTEHYEPLLVRSQPLIAACCVATLVLIAIAWAMIGESIVRVSITGSILTVTVGGFAAGSCHRLSDLRTRRGRILRLQANAAGEIAKLPPLETIRRRLRVSISAWGTGSLGLLATTLVSFLGEYPESVGQWSVVVSILAMVISALCFLAATNTRPLD
jgi:peptidoglycan/LPS O-acetylase OafA/YrhL